MKPKVESKFGRGGGNYDSAGQALGRRSNFNNTKHDIKKSRTLFGYLVLGEGATMAMFWMLALFLEVAGAIEREATVFVTVQPCLRGACRTGHQMDNIISAFIAVAIMDGKGPGKLPWRYLHQTSSNRNGNDAAEIFDLMPHVSAAAGFDRAS